MLSYYNATQDTETLQRALPILEASFPFFLGPFSDTSLERARLVGQEPFFEHYLTLYQQSKPISQLVNILLTPPRPVSYTTMRSKTRPPALNPTAKTILPQTGTTSHQPTPTTKKLRSTLNSLLVPKQAGTILRAGPRTLLSATQTTRAPSCARLTSVILRL
jgi:hypothetical protein